MTMQCESPATATVPRLASEAIPRAMMRAGAVPRTGEECDQMLRRAERAMALANPGDIAADLARFLGAGSAVWTIGRRARLRELLVNAGQWGVRAVLNELAQHPRAEVFDDAAQVLRALLRSAPFFSRELASAAGGEVNASVRALLATALDQSADPYAHRALAGLLEDESGIVREAAASSLASARVRQARPSLERRIAKEADEGTRAVLADALDELSR